MDSTNPLPASPAGFDCDPVPSMTLALLTGQTSWRSASVAAIFLGGAAAMLALSLRSQPSLAASVTMRFDSDGDGLSDLQELVLGTSPDFDDSDADGFSDLEEKARGTNPLEIRSQPTVPELDVGMFSTSEDGLVIVASAVYAPDGELNDLAFDFGIVLRGRPVVVPFGSYSHMSRFVIVPGRAAGSKVAVVEIAFRESLVQRRGQLDFFSGVRNPSLQAAAVDVDTLINFSGVTMSVDDRPSNLMFNGYPAPAGVVYRPIGGDDQIPATWSGGQICWQRTVPVGTNGASVIHEVEAASCEPMDSYCGSTDCSASVGKPLELPDPGALIGG